MNECMNLNEESKHSAAERIIIVSISLEPIIAFHVFPRIYELKETFHVFKQQKYKLRHFHESNFLKRHKSVAVYITNDNDFLSLP